MENSIPSRIGPYKDIGEKTLLENFSAYLAELQADLEEVKAKIKGDYLVSKPGLATGSTTQNVSNIEFDFQINGVRYTKAAVAAGTALAGDDVPQNQYGAFRLEIGTNGTVDIIAASDNATGYASAVLALAGLPDLSSNHAEMGTVTVMNTAAAFDPGTTAISVGTVTEAFTDGQTAFEAISDV